jgi:MFS family permease
VNTIGLVVGVHIAAMYLPSPVTGWLADTIGARVVAGAGALLLLLAGGGFGLVGLVAAAPCLPLLAAVAAGGGRRAGAPPAGPALDPPVPGRGGR